MGISATNRNFKGRMGSRERAVLPGEPRRRGGVGRRGEASPGTGKFEALRARDRDARRASPHGARAAGVEILAGLSGGGCEGELVFLPKDNMNTDGIYGNGRHCTGTTSRPEEMATHAFRNYDPEFQKIGPKPGDLIVGAAGTSARARSREQAATAIKYFGIPLVIAASFSQTYKRNAFNNGFPVLECPDLVGFLAERTGTVTRRTVRTGVEAVVDFRASDIRADGREFPFLPLGEVPQRLVVAGGTESWVRERIGKAGPPS